MKTRKYSHWHTEHTQTHLGKIVQQMKQCLIALLAQTDEFQQLI